jgi:uncharacterized protein (DUF1778 family)
VTAPAAARRKRSENRQRTELVGLRLLPAERVTLDAAAKAAGLSLSEFIRVAALAAAAMARRRQS